MKHSEYKIVTAQSFEQLSEKVNNLLDKGWSVQGGVSFSTSNMGNVWQAAQAMVR